MAAQQQKKFKNNYLFEYLKNILSTKSLDVFQNHLDNDFDQSYQPFMINSYLSMSLDPNVRKVIFDNQISLDKMTNKQHYRFLLGAVPKQTNSFIRYVR